MTKRWTEFLADSEEAGHGVEIYTRDEELVDSVATFLAAGFAVDAPGLVVTTPAHATAITDELAARGFDGRLLLMIDAEQAAEALYTNRRFSARSFERVANGFLDLAEAAGTGRLRVFGEVVDLLRLRGAMSDAIALEHMWEDLRSRRPFSLLCGYRLDVFDAAVQGSPLPEICSCHTHVLPAHDLERFSNAVTRALTDVLGTATTRDVYYIVDHSLRGHRIPVAQDALRWVAASLPNDADAVLATARGYYDRVEAA